MNASVPTVGTGNKIVPAGLPVEREKELTAHGIHASMGVAWKAVVSHEEAKLFPLIEQIALRDGWHTRFQLPPTPKPISDPTKTLYEIYNGDEFVASLVGLEKAKAQCLETTYGYLVIYEKGNAKASLHEKGTPVLYCFCGEFSTHATPIGNPFDFFDLINAYETDPTVRKEAAERIRARCKA